MQELEKDPKRERLVSGKLAIVTGGARSIGKAIVQEFLLQGASVAIFDVQDFDISEFASVDDGKVFFLKVDITDEAAVTKAYTKTEEHFGKPVDTIVNNAATTHSALVQEHAMDDWLRIIQTNLNGQFIVTREAISQMKKAQVKGSITFITSIHAMQGFEGSAAYDAAKSGVLGLMRGIVDEAGRLGIRTNAIAPGVIANTGMSNLSGEEMKRYAKIIPIGRVGFPEDVANLAVFLASDKASFIHGAHIPIDGGTTAVSSLPRI